MSTALNVTQATPRDGAVAKKEDSTIRIRTTLAAGLRVMVSVAAVGAGFALVGQSGIETLGDGGAQLAGRICPIGEISCQGDSEDTRFCNNDCAPRKYGHDNCCDRLGLACRYCECKWGKDCLGTSG